MLLRYLFLELFQLVKWRPLDRDSRGIYVPGPPSALLLLPKCRRISSPCVRQQKGPGGLNALPAPSWTNAVSLWGRPATAGGSGLSRAAEADAYLAAFHHHRHPAVTIGEAQHLLHGLGIFDDIFKNHGQSFPALGLPGLEGEGSRLLAEDGNLLCHGPPPQWESRK